MGLFEYVSILTSIIVGLGLTQLLFGVSRLIADPADVRPYWVHLTWVANQYLLVVFVWWYEFRLAEFEQWSFPQYFFLTLYFTTLYLQCVLLFPREISGYQTFREYYYARRHWLFGMWIFGLLIDFGDTAMKGYEHFIWLGPEYLGRQAVMIALFVVAIFWPNERFHGSLAVASLIYWITWVLRYYPALS